MSSSSFFLGRVCHIDLRTNRQIYLVSAIKLFVFLRTCQSLNTGTVYLLLLVVHITDSFIFNVL
jgi:hypothetical protein